MATSRLKFLPIVVCLAFGLAACGDDAKSTDDVTTPTESAGRGDYDSETTVDDSTETSVDDSTDTSVDDSTDTSVDDSTDTSVDDSTDTSVDDSGEGDDVILTDSTFGPILSDGEGNTLYLFTSDGVDTPTCTGGCASAWPAFVTDDDQVHVGDGLDDDMFAIVDGPNGAQLSFNGHPLYYFAGDSAPGDTNGQGSGGVWFILDADGNQITA